MGEKIYVELTRTQLNLLKVAMISQTLYARQVLENADTDNMDNDTIMWIETLNQCRQLTNYLKDVGNTVA